MSDKKDVQKVLEIPEALETQINNSYGRPKALRKEDIETIGRLLASTNGNISQAAKVLGVNRKTLSTYVKENPDINSFITDAYEKIVDDAEAIIIKHMRGRPAIPATDTQPAQDAIPENVDLAWKVAQTMGSPRGWSDKVNIKIKADSIDGALDILQNAPQALLLERIRARASFTNKNLMKIEDAITR